MRKLMVLAALAATLGSAPAAAQLCDFTYSGSPGTGYDVNWQIACEALNDGLSGPAIKITGMNLRQTAKVGSVKSCKFYGYLIDNDVQPALPAGPYQVVYNGYQEVEKRECMGYGPTPGWADQPAKSPTLTRSKILTLPGEIMYGMYWTGAGLSQIVITADYYPDATNTTVYPMVLRMTRGGGSGGSSRPPWRLQSYEYICDDNDLPYNPYCSERPKAAHSGPAGWHSYVILNPSEAGPARQDEVNFMYQDGSGSVQLASWRQFCKQDSLYVQAARAYYLNQSGNLKDICTCTVGTNCP